MPTILTVPGGIDFAGFYYPEILRAMLEDLRARRDELGLTDENEFEVHVQFLRAFANVGHLNNTRTDVIASELLIGTAGLLESVKRLLRLTGIELSSASPAVVDLLLEMSDVTTTNQVGFIPELAEFSTDSTPPITYEVLQEDGYDRDRSDRASYVFGLEETKTGDGGFVNTVAPDIFNKGGSDPNFAATDVSSHLFIPKGLSGNGGEFRIVEFISTSQVRLVTVPGSISPNFQDETGINYSVKAFTADYAYESYTPASTFDPWASVVAGDMLFVGHKHHLVDRLDFDMTVMAASITGVWEYFDNTHSRFNPTEVTDNLDGTITFDVSSLLGTVSRQGASITVEHLPTGSVEHLESAWVGGKNVATTQGVLGQASISEDIEDYEITADWVPFYNQDDQTSNLSADGEVTWDLPQTQYRNWQKTEVNLEEAYWSRYRVISVSTPTEPTIDLIDIDQGAQYMIVQATQGETIGPQVLGSSDGSPRQEFLLPDTPYLDGTAVIEVDEAGGGNWQEYQIVVNFLNSTATSRHCMLEKSATDQATIRFGDGTTGKIPPSGTDNVRAEWRIGGDSDGNVGVGEVSENSDGTPGISSVTNPRAAAGWKIKDGGTPADLERVKRDKPAEQRTRGTASNPGDLPSLIINSFVDRNGSKPVARVQVFEEGLGIKTVKVMVVGTGGTTLTPEQRVDLDLYLNGDRYARPPTFGIMGHNTRAYAFNYEPLLITVDATVTWPGGNAQQIRTALQNLLTPLAVEEEDGVTWVFDFGGYVSHSRVSAAIHSVHPAVSDVPSLSLNGTAGSVKLSANNLPITTAASIKLNIQG